jgi:hypothetical protein
VASLQLATTRSDPDLELGPGTPVTSQCPDRLVTGHISGEERQRPMESRAGPEIESRQTRLVRVWFGNEVICSHQAPAWQARRYVASIGRQFAGLRITIDGTPTGREPALPHELLWDHTVR